MTDNGSATGLDWAPPRITTTGDPVDAERIPIFYIDDREYSAPARVAAPDALRALEIAATRGPAQAAWYMLTQSLGEDAVKALTECRHVTLDDVQSIFGKLSAMYYGQMESMVGIGSAGK